MDFKNFVGRQSAFNSLQDVLTGKVRATGQVTVQSIEGPGGIGKTCLLNYVKTRTNFAERNYLELSINGSDFASNDLMAVVSHIVDTATAEQISQRINGNYFANTKDVFRFVNKIKQDAVAELKQKYPGDKDTPQMLSSNIDEAIKLGRAVNDIFPLTKKYVNASSAGNHAKRLKDVIPALVSLSQSAPKLLERLGKVGTQVRNNAVKQNACRSLAEALISDLSAILSGYCPKDRWRPAHKKIPGIDRLLLVIDDYEKLEDTLEEFLVAYLLPDLGKAQFESLIIILGRDQLQLTHPAWDQHLNSALLRPVALDPLSRQEMDALIEGYGIHKIEDKERAWRDTQGYPYYVQLWTEEVENSGIGRLKRFYDRTTRWMNEHEKVWLDHTLFLDDVNKRTLRYMLGSPEEAEDAFQWFEKNGSVRDATGDVYKVREYLRSRLKDYLRKSDPDQYDELQRKASLIQADDE